MLVSDVKYLIQVPSRRPLWHLWYYLLQCSSVNQTEHVIYGYGRRLAQLCLALTTHSLPTHLNNQKTAGQYRESFQTVVVGKVAHLISSYLRSTKSRLRVFVNYRLH